MGKHTDTAIATVASLWGGATIGAVLSNAGTGWWLAWVASGIAIGAALYWRYRTG